MKWPRSAVFHPFVFAAIPVVSSLLVVKTQVLPEEIIAPLVAFEIGTVVVLVIALAWFRDAFKAGIFCSVFLGLFCTFRAFEYPINLFAQSVTGFFAPGWVVLLIYGLLMIVCLLSVLKTTWRFGKSSFVVLPRKFNEALNLASVLLLFTNLVPLVTFEFQQESVSRQIVDSFQGKFANVCLRSNTNKPDVYYIILDGFANSHTLKEFWNYDNKRFIEFLTNSGFYVVPRAASNYDRTHYSITSSMNMQYLTPLLEKSQVQNIFWRLLQDNTVARMFKKLGYKFVNISSGNGATDYMLDADVNLRDGFGNYFTIAVAQLTPLVATEQYLPLLRDLYAQMKLRPEYCLNQVFKIKGPKFVLIHTDIAHAPDIFDQYGNKQTIPLVNLQVDWGTPTAYINQLKFSETEAMKWISEILNQPGEKPIIILQSDHGPGIPAPTLQLQYNERMRILNAYYFPGMHHQGLYGSITPVNSFRVLFNDYFDTRLPILEDQSFCAPVFEHEYDLRDVTKILRF